jgi:uncharacterized protein
MSNRSTNVIAGGTGMIGRALTRHWLDAGQRVVILSRQRTANVPRGAETVCWDSRHDGGWRSRIEDARVVVNLCGENIGARRWTAARKHRLVDSRTEPTAALVAALQRGSPPATLIQASGVGCYGTSEMATFTERDPPGGDFLALLSRQWEAAAMPAADVTRLVIARFGVVLAPAAGAFPKLVQPFRFGIGGPIGSGRQWLSWIHIADAVRALDFLARRDDISGAVNCTAPNPIRNDAAARAIGHALRRPAIVALPRFVLRAALGEMATLVCDGQRVLPERLRAAGFDFHYPDFGAATTQLLGR